MLHCLFKLENKIPTSLVKKTFLITILDSRKFPLRRLSFEFIDCSFNCLRSYENSLTIKPKFKLKLYIKK